MISPSQAAALTECQHQFKGHRWNCTFSDKLTEDVIIQRGLLEGKCMACHLGIKTYDSLRSENLQLGCDIIKVYRYIEIELYGKQEGILWK